MDKKYWLFPWVTFEGQNKSDVTPIYFVSGKLTCSEMCQHGRVKVAWRTNRSHKQITKVQHATGHSSKSLTGHSSWWRQQVPQQITAKSQIPDQITVAGENSRFHNRSHQQVREASGKRRPQSRSQHQVATSTSSESRGMGSFIGVKGHSRWRVTNTPSITDSKECTLCFNRALVLMDQRNRRLNRSRWNGRSYRLE